MKFEYSLTSNWENAIRGLRHPYESYDKSDSEFGISQKDLVYENKLKKVASSYIQNWNDERIDLDEENVWSWLRENGIIQNNKNNAIEYAFIGAKDLDLVQRMIAAGSPNDKFLRQIFVSVDITAPLYFFKELDTYKIGTTANSTSTMHKLATTPITLDCFETDDLQDFKIGKSDYSMFGHANYILTTINYLEDLRLKYLETKDKKYWKELIRWLPESWLQTRTWTANYAVLRNIIHWRRGHKLTEWSSFIEWAKTLPYANELLFYKQ